MQWEEPGRGASPFNWMLQEEEEEEAPATSTPPPPLSTHQPCCMGITLQRNNNTWISTSVIRPGLTSSSSSPATPCKPHLLLFLHLHPPEAGVRTAMNNVRVSSAGVEEQRGKGWSRSTSTTPVPSRPHSPSLQRIKHSHSL